MIDIICKRCGKCCHLPNSKPCKYLLKVGDTTSCKIYSKRLGTRIAFNYACFLRKDIHKNFDGCPFNKDEYEVGENAR